MGSLILTGSTTPIQQLPIEERTRIMQGWANSRIPQFNNLFKQMTTLGRLIYVRTSTSFPKITGFPRTPETWISTPSYKYEFLKPTRSQGTCTIETDVVI